MLISYFILSLQNQNVLPTSLICILIYIKSGGKSVHELEIDIRGSGVFHITCHVHHYHHTYKPKYVVCFFIESILSISQLGPSAKNLLSIGSADPTYMWHPGDIQTGTRWLEFSTSRFLCDPQIRGCD